MVAYISYSSNRAARLGSFGTLAGPGLDQKHRATTATSVLRDGSAAVTTPAHALPCLRATKANCSRRNSSAYTLL